MKGWIRVFIEGKGLLFHPPLKGYNGFLVKFVICICIIITSPSLLCVCVSKEKKKGKGLICINNGNSFIVWCCK